MKIIQETRRVHYIWCFSFRCILFCLSGWICEFQRKSVVTNTINILSPEGESEKINYKLEQANLLITSKQLIENREQVPRSNFN